MNCIQISIQETVFQRTFLCSILPTQQLEGAVQSKSDHYSFGEIHSRVPISSESKPWLGYPTPLPSGPHLLLLNHSSCTGFLAIPQIHWACPCLRAFAGTLLSPWNVLCPVIYIASSLTNQLQILTQTLPWLVLP